METRVCYIAIIFIVFSISFSSAQSLKYKKDINIDNDNYTLILNLNNDNIFEFTIKERDGESEKFLLNNLSFINFSEEIRNIFELWELDSPNDETLKRIYVDINDNYPNTPLAGEITINDKVNLYKGYSSLKSTKNKPKALLKVENVTLEVNNGLIENMLVETSNLIKSYDDNLDTIFFSDKKFIFSLVSPVQFSKMRDFRRVINDNKYLTTSIRDKSIYYSINLGEVIQSYAPILNPNRKDYSPKSGTYFLVPGSTFLDKENVSDLFSLRLYTDLFGLGPQPNGLVQTEFEKDIKLWVHPFQCGESSNYFNLFHNIRPLVTLSRIQGNDFSAPINYTFSSGDSIPPTYFINLMELKKYENFIVGFRIYYLGFTMSSLSLKFQVSLQTTFHSASTRGTRFQFNDATNTYDITDGDFQINTLSFELAPAILELSFFPNDFMNFGIEYTPFIRNSLFNSDEVKLIEKKASENNVKDLRFVSNYKYNRFELFGRFFTGNDNHIFARYRLNYQMKRNENFFQQFQVGYLVQITPKRSDVK